MHVEGFLAIAEVVCGAACCELNAKTAKWSKGRKAGGGKRRVVVVFGMRDTAAGS